MIVILMMSTGIHYFVDNHVNKNQAKRNPPPTVCASHITGKKEGNGNKKATQGNEMTNECVRHRLKVYLST